MIKNCYIHIPFCQSICSYCDFCKLLYNEKFINKYLDSLEKEIKDIYNGEELETIYIGGGTPSCLSTHQLERLFKILEIFKKSKNIEYTIEGNFETTTKEKLELYKKYGINRLSLGIESINKDNLKFMNRTLVINEVKEKINMMRKLGFNNINLDLIYALPNETINTLSKDIEFILSLNIEHISTYSLIIENNTILKINNEQNIDEELDEKMYYEIINRLKENNYNHYEISNFSKKGYESKHNMCYWNNNEYYGFGLGASSYINNKRMTNTRSITSYNNRILGKEIEIVNKNDKIEYEIMLNLRLIDGIDLKEFKNKYQKDLKDLYDYQYLLKNKFLIEENNHLKIPEDKLYISNEIIVKILQNKI